MADKHVLKLGSILKFFEEDPRLVNRAENAVESGHVVHMQFDGELGIVKGKA